jgi:hypothetical protein
MALKGKKLHPDDIQGIRGFVMVYKGLTTFVMTYKKLAHKTYIKIHAPSSCEHRKEPPFPTENKEQKLYDDEME